MKMSQTIRLLIFGIAVSMLATVNVDAQFEETARWIPDSANSLAIVRADKIFESEIAKKERWKTDRIKAFQAGATFLPPSTEQLLMASQFDFEYMDPIWQVAIFERSGPAIDVLKVSQRIGGNLEKIGDNDAIVLPNDAYLVKIGDNTLGTMTPANRQVTARWLATQKFATMSLSNYLTQAVSFAEDNAAIVVAFDLESALHSDEIMNRLKESGLVKEEQLAEVVKTLATIQGLTLGVTVNDKVTGAIKIDFASSPANIGPLGKQLLLHALEKNSLMIPDFQNWEMQVKGNQLLMMGPLSEMGLRQIGSLIEHPLVPDFLADESAGSSQVDMKTRSLQYFGAIQTLSKELRDEKFQAMTTYAKFFDKYARQIDNLSVLNVDPVVLSYGAYVADSFRSVSAGLLDVNLQKVQDRSTYEAGSSDYHGRGDYTNWNGNTSRFGWGGGGYDSNMRNRQRVSGQANLQGEIGAKDIIREVDAKTAEVKQQMSQKYQVDF